MNRFFFLQVLLHVCLFCLLCCPVLSLLSCVVSVTFCLVFNPCCPVLDPWRLWQLSILDDGSVVDSLLYVPNIVLGFCVCSLFCYEFDCVLSSYAIILIR